VIIKPGEYPPNYEAINKRFSLDKLENEIYKPFFCWGLFIYNPHNAFVGPELFAHEQEHSARQGLNPGGWWDQYIGDDTFRLIEELAAHVIEYKVLVEHHGKTRGQRRQLFHHTASRLCAPLYGYQPRLPYDRAREFLKKAIKQAEMPTEMPQGQMATNPNSK
jgi:hypothetical protein